MVLDDLLKYKKITIQCHDNPDPDAIASGFLLYEYYLHKNCDVRLIYSGRNVITKPNIALMVEKLEIPLEYRRVDAGAIEGLLITVDCQYGEGNVTRFDADEIACVDHHVDCTHRELSIIQPVLGACATLVWSLTRHALKEFEPQLLRRIHTALYYGLSTDTSTFVEMHHPLDRDMLDILVYEKSLITLFCNSNISISELETAGIALIRHVYDDTNRSLIIHSNPCDPNILGLISDLAIQVASVDVCLVYNETPDGFKMSVRSCTKEVHANELAMYFAEGIGGAGGHVNKAGGFIFKDKMEDLLHGESSETFFGKRMADYFKSCQVIYAKDYDIDLTGMEKYKKREDLILGYSDPSEFLAEGTEISIRTLEGDVDQKISKDFYIMIGLEGEVYPISKEKFGRTYSVPDCEYVYSGQYAPVVHDKGTGMVIDLVEHAHPCQAIGVSYILTKELDKTVKIFTTWDDEKYYLGKPGDFIACRFDDHKDVYVIQRDIFFKTYIKSE